MPARNQFLSLGLICGILCLLDEKSGPPSGGSGVFAVAGLWERFLQPQGCRACPKDVDAGSGEDPPGGSVARNPGARAIWPGISAACEAQGHGESRTGLFRMRLQRSPSCAKIVSSVEVVTDVINRGQDYLERRWMTPRKFIRGSVTDRP